jgi:hypothetical protein
VKFGYPTTLDMRQRQQDVANCMLGAPIVGVGYQQYIQFGSDVIIAARLRTKWNDHGVQSVLWVDVLKVTAAPGTKKRRSRPFLFSLRGGAK